MGLVNRSTKRADRCKVFHLKTFSFTNINVIRDQLKSLKSAFITSWEAIKTCHYPMRCSIAQNFKANGWSFVDNYQGNKNLFKFTKLQKSNVS